MADENQSWDLGSLTGLCVLLSGYVLLAATTTLFIYHFSKASLQSALTENIFSFSIVQSQIKDRKYYKKEQKHKT